uniref:Uncharacterized protein n=1 Tax=Anguilla anguilla TaxID=7936 RepID=A0A0E9WHE4_ANGAN
MYTSLVGLSQAKVVHNLFLPVGSANRGLHPRDKMQLVRLLGVPAIFLVLFGPFLKHLWRNAWFGEFAA